MAILAVRSGTRGRTSSADLANPGPLQRLALASPSLEVLYGHSIDGVKRESTPLLPYEHANSFGSWENLRDLNVPSVPLATACNESRCREGPLRTRHMTCVTKTRAARRKPSLILQFERVMSGKTYNTAFRPLCQDGCRSVSRRVRGSTALRGSSVALHPRREPRGVGVRETRFSTPRAHRIPLLRNHDVRHFKSLAGSSSGTSIAPLMGMQTEWHALDEPTVVKRLGSNAERGLSEVEISRKHAEHGPTSYIISAGTALE